jgi:hypothetical protein
MNRSVTEKQENRYKLIRNLRGFILKMEKIWGKQNGFYERKA